MVEVQPEAPQRLGAGDAVDHKPGSPLEFANHGGGARPVDPVDDEVRIQRIVTVQPGLQEADKIIAVARSQYNCHTSTLRRIPFSGKAIDSLLAEQHHPTKPWRLIVAIWRGSPICANLGLAAARRANNECDADQRNDRADDGPGRGVAHRAAADDAEAL